MSSAASSKDGGKSTFVVADETHLWYTMQLRNLHATVKRNIVKRKIGDGWMLETSTAYKPGQNSVAEGSLGYALMVMSGKVSDPSLLVDHREASERHNLNTVEGRRAALVEVYGEAAGWTNIDGILSEWHDPEVDKADWRRYWLNQVVASSDQFIAPKTWADRHAPRYRVRTGTRICLGFDGSLYDDWTALIAITLEDGFIFPIQIFNPKDFGGKVPASAVDAAVAKAFKEYEVVRFYPDPPYWQDEVDGWHAEYGDAVVEWWTNRRTPMARAVERFQTAAQTGGLMHDGDAALAEHVGNTHADMHREGLLLRKEFEKSPKKIDACVAAVLANEARHDAIADGALNKKRSRKVVVLR